MPRISFGQKRTRTSHAANLISNRWLSRTLWLQGNQRRNVLSTNLLRPGLKLKRFLCRRLLLHERLWFGLPTTTAPIPGLLLWSESDRFPVRPGMLARPLVLRLRGVRQPSGHHHGSSVGRRSNFKGRFVLSLSAAFVSSQLRRFVNVNLVFVSSVASIWKT